MWRTVCLSTHQSRLRRVRLIVSNASERKESQFIFFINQFIYENQSNNHIFLLSPIQSLFAIYSRRVLTDNHTRTCCAKGRKAKKKKKCNDGRRLISYSVRNVYRGACAQRRCNEQVTIFEFWVWWLMLVLLLFAFYVLPLNSYEKENAGK